MTLRPLLTVRRIRLLAGLVMFAYLTQHLLNHALGIVSLALACAGIYSIVSYSAAERIHELGVRVALGARPSDLLRELAESGGQLREAKGRMKR